MVYISRVQRLIQGFLEHKREFGSLSEKAVYENLEWEPSGLLDRLFRKRCVCFLNNNDIWKLRDGTNGAGGFEDVGCDGKQTRPLVIFDVLSYDEIAINALLGFSSFSKFFNRGGRSNEGIAEHPSLFVHDGIVVGMVGSRLDAPPCTMEFQHIVVTKNQNTIMNGYGTDEERRRGCNNCQMKRGRRELMQLWARFYGVSHFPLYDEALASSDNENFDRLYEDVNGDMMFFNKEVYVSRVSIMAETLLFEANKRGRDEGKRSYVHIVGLGLGVWGVKQSLQAKLYISTFLEVASKHAGNLIYIGVLDFSYVVEPSKRETWELYPGLPFKVHFSYRNPQSVGNDVDKMLLIVSYAWDGNAWPGNEFYFGNLSSSGYVSF